MLQRAIDSDAVRHHPDCEHQYIDAVTGRVVLPVVNVFAAPGKSSTMTVGRRYRCIACHRVVDLRIRAFLSLPEAPIDSRTIDPFTEWPDVAPEPVAQGEPAAHARRPTAGQQHRAVA